MLILAEAVGVVPVPLLSALSLPCNVSSSLILLGVGQKRFHFYQNFLQGNFFSFKSKFAVENLSWSIEKQLSFVLPLPQRCLRCDDIVKAV